MTGGNRNMIKRIVNFIKLHFDPVANDRWSKPKELDYYKLGKIIHEKNKRT